MKKSKKKIILKKNAKRILVFGFFSFAIITSVMISVLTVVNQIIEKHQEANQLEEKMLALEEDEKKLNLEILKLQDSEYLARYAREKYFYSKSGELIIRIPTENTQ